MLLSEPLPESALVVTVYTVPAAWTPRGVGKGLVGRERVSHSRVLRANAIRKVRVTVWSLFGFVHIIALLNKIVN
jgi:hypothetical protein